MNGSTQGVFFQNTVIRRKCAVLADEKGAFTFWQMAGRKHFFSNGLSHRLD